MANLKASKKAIKTSERNRQRNQSAASQLKTEIKQTMAAIESKSKESGTILRQTLRFMDKLVSRGIFKKSTIARRKSRLQKKFNAA